MERAKSQGVNAEGLLEVGTDAAETIINVANNLNVDLIVVGSRGVEGINEVPVGVCE